MSWSSWNDAAAGVGAVFNTVVDAGSGALDAAKDVVDEGVAAVTGMANDAADAAGEAWDDFVDGVDEHTTFGFDESGNFAVGVGDPQRGGFVMVVDANPTDGSLGYAIAVGTEEAGASWGSQYSVDGGGLYTKGEMAGRIGEHSGSYSTESLYNPTGIHAKETVTRREGEDFEGSRTFQGGISEAGAYVAGSSTGREGDVTESSHWAAATDGAGLSAAGGSSRTEGDVAEATRWDASITSDRATAGGSVTNRDGDDVTTWHGRVGVDEEGAELGGGVYGTNDDIDFKAGGTVHTDWEGNVTPEGRGQAAGTTEDGTEWLVEGEAGYDQERGLTAGGRGQAEGTTEDGTEWSAEGEAGYDQERGLTAGGRGQAEGTTEDGTEWSAEGEAGYDQERGLTAGGRGQAEGTTEDGAEWSADGELKYEDDELTGELEGEASARVGDIDVTLRARAILEEGKVTTWLSTDSGTEDALRGAVARLVNEGRQLYEHGQQQFSGTIERLEEAVDTSEVAGWLDGIAEAGDELTEAGDELAALQEVVADARSEHLEQLIDARGRSDELLEEHYERVEVHLERARDTIEQGDAQIDPRLTTLQQLRENTLGQRREELERFENARDREEQSSTETDDGPPDAAAEVTAEQLRDYLEGQSANHMMLVVAAAARAEAAGEVLDDAEAEGGAVASILLEASALEVAVAEITTDEVELLAGEAAKIRLAALQAEAAGDLRGAELLGRTADGFARASDRSTLTSHAAKREAETTAETTAQVAEARPDLVSAEVVEAVNAAAEVVDLAAAGTEEFVAEIDTADVEEEIATAEMAALLEPDLDEAGHQASRLLDKAERLEEQADRLHSLANGASESSAARYHAQAEKMEARARDLQDRAQPQTPETANQTEDVEPTETAESAEAGEYGAVEDAVPAADEAETDAGASSDQVAQQPEQAGTAATFEGRDDDADGTGNWVEMPSAEAEVADDEPEGSMDDFGAGAAANPSYEPVMTYPGTPQVAPPDAASVWPAHDTPVVPDLEVLDPEPEQLQEPDLEPVLEVEPIDDMGVDQEDEPEPAG